MGFLIANGNFSFMGAVPFASYGERTTADASVVLKLGISKFEGHDYTADALLIPVVGIPLQNSSLAFDFSIPAGGYEEGTIVAVLGSTNKAATLGASLFGFLVNKGV